MQTSRWSRNSETIGHDCKFLEGILNFVRRVGSVLISKGRKREKNETFDWKIFYPLSCTLTTRKSPFWELTPRIYLFCFFFSFFYSSAWRVKGNAITRRRGKKSGKIALLIPGTRRDYRRQKDQSRNGIRCVNYPGINVLITLRHRAIIVSFKLQKWYSVKFNFKLANALWRAYVEEPRPSRVEETFLSFLRV